MTRGEILEALERDHQKLLALLDGLPEPALTTSGVVGLWSIKDLLGHMAMWQAVALQFIADYRQDGLPKSLGLNSDAAIDAYNERGSTLRRDWSYERVWNEFEETHQALFTAVKSLIDADLNHALPAPWTGTTTLERLIAINSYDHNPEHLEQIRKWRQSYSSTAGNG